MSTTPHAGSRADLRSLQLGEQLDLLRVELHLGEDSRVAELGELANLIHDV